MRALDPGPDISGSLAHLNRGELGDVGVALVVEEVAAILPSLHALLERAVERLLTDG